MSQKRISRQQEYAMEEAENRRHYHHDSYAHSAYRSEYTQYSGRRNNTMAPPEDVLDARKDRRVPLSIQHATGQSRNVLIENVILLTILVASIYGLYNLTIYLLNQA